MLNSVAVDGEESDPPRLGRILDLIHQQAGALGDTDAVRVLLVVCEEEAVGELDLVRVRSLGDRDLPQDSRPAGIGDRILVVGPADWISLVNGKLQGRAAGEKHFGFPVEGPGERLHETLWDATALVQPTQNSDVKRIVERDLLSDDSLAAVIRRLREAAPSGDALTIRMILAEAIPSFVAADHAKTPA